MHALLDGHVEGAAVDAGKLLTLDPVDAEGDEADSEVFGALIDGDYNLDVRRRFIVGGVRERGLEPDVGGVARRFSLFGGCVRAISEWEDGERCSHREKR